MRPLSVLLSLPLLLHACSDGGVETVFDPCSPLAIAPDPGTEASEIQAIEDAAFAWARVLPTQIRVGSPQPDVPAVYVRFETADSYYRAVYWDAVGQISISRTKLAKDEFAAAITHELGHAFGLLHVPADERPSVMNVGNLVIAPNAEDAEAVSAIWPACRSRQDAAL